MQCPTARSPRRTYYAMCSQQSSRNDFQVGFFVETDLEILRDQFWISAREMKSRTNREVNYTQKSVVGMFDAVFSLHERTSHWQNIHVRCVYLLIPQSSIRTRGSEKEAALRPRVWNFAPRRIGKRGKKLESQIIVFTDVQCCGQRVHAV